MTKPPLAGITDASGTEDRAAASAATASTRRANFQAAIRPELVAREDAFRKRMALDNSSRRSKLRKIYAFTDELSHLREPFIACRRGCSDCCRMNVMISDLEAETIASAIGRQAVRLQRALAHPLDAFNGTACPFLRDGECGIYEHRPYACRKHANFDTSAYWCEPSRSNGASLPMVEFSEVKGAFSDVTKLGDGGIFADIRDFFQDVGGIDN